MKKLNRKENATRNIIFGICLKLYQILIPFIMRTAMLYLMGVQYLGLNSLFTSILQVLNLAELGVGSAMVYSMYKPIAEDDTKRICALLKLYRKYYLFIGLIIGIVGILITPIVPQLITGSVPKGINIYVLYLLNLATTVASYWILAYKGSVLQAHQRVDIISKVTIITNTIQYVLQIIVLWILRDYYIYIMTALATQIATNIVTALIANKIYPRYVAKGNLDKEEVKCINNRIKDLFTARLGGTITNSADTIVISMFLGLTTLAIYQNYFFIMSSIIGFTSIIFSSVIAGIGNSLITETAEKNYYDLKRLAFFMIWVTSVCISCFACLFQPFMTIWVGKDYLLPYSIVVLLCIYFYLYVMQNLSCVYKDAAGIWHSDRFRPLIGGLFNLILNLILVNFWGLYAIVLSTIFSYIFIAMPWIVHNLFKFVFNRSPKEYIILIIKGFFIAGFIAGACYYICFQIRLSGIIQVIVYLLIALTVSNVLFILLMRKNEMFNSTIDLLDSVTKHKLNKIFKVIKKEKKDNESEY